MEWMAPASGIAMCHIGFCMKSPMTGAIHSTNGICERLHRTIKDEFHDIVQRDDHPLDEILKPLHSASSATVPWRHCRSPLDVWLAKYNGQRLIREETSRCLIRGFDGAIHSLEWKDALLDRYAAAALRLRTQSEQQYSDRKLRPRS
jgi:hypothetical protein